MRWLAKPRLVLLIVANMTVWGVLSFYQQTSAAPRGARQPFANSVEQRAEMIEQLKAVRQLLKEQNDLLRSGKLAVTLIENPNP